MRSFRPAALAVLFGAVLMMAPSHAQTGSLPVPLKLTAFAVNMTNIATGGTNVVDIVINQWSPEPVRQRLIQTFVEKGPTKLLDALQDQKPVGYIKLPQTLGYDLRFARQVPLPDGGTKIISVTDRPINEFEAREQARTLDYPFTIIEIHLKKDLTGEGKISVATKITLNKKDNSVELENWESEPVRLTTVKISK
jgi:hypothetical protein